MWMLLLGRVERDLELFRDAFRGDMLPALGPPYYWALGLAVVGALGASWALWHLVRRDRASWGPTNRRICAAIGIGWRDRRLLRRVAQAANMSHVAAILISEGGFEHAAGHYARAHGSAARLRAIRLRVFGP